MREGDVNGDSTQGLGAVVMCHLSASAADTCTSFTVLSNVHTHFHLYITFHTEKKKEEKRKALSVT